MKIESYEYKTINMELTPISSEVSQYKIQEKCNQYGQEGWELVRFEIHNDNNIMLIFKRPKEK